MSGKLDESTDSGNFSVTGYLPLIGKDSLTYIHGLADYMKEEISFAQRFTSLSVLTLFLYRSPSLSLFTVFDFISSNIDEVLLINPAANEFVFGDVNVHHKDSLTNSGGIDRTGELCYKFSISNCVTQMFNFPTRIPDCDSDSAALLDLFISSQASVCSTMAFHPLGNSDHVFV